MIQLKNSKSIEKIKQYKLQEEFDQLYDKSKKNINFKNIFEIISSRNNILLAYSQICGMNLSFCSDAEGRTIENLKNISEEKLVEIIQKKMNKFEPGYVKKVQSFKANGSIKTIGIPLILDKIIQQCILQVLEPILEAKFYKGSYGGRPYRTHNNALADLYKKIQTQNLHFVVNIEIENFYSSVCHKKLLRQLWSLGIHDKRILKIIKLILKAKIIEPDGQIVSNNKGIIQSGILSYLLANVVLNEFDWWVSSQWENIPTKHAYQGFKHKNGQRSKNPKYNALRINSNLKEVYIVRHLEEIKIICRKYSDAKRIREASVIWMDKRLKLKSFKTKSNITNLKKNYMYFLGFQIKVRKKGNKYTVASKIHKRNIKLISRKLKNILKDIEHSYGNKRLLNISLYNSTVISLHQYYSCATDVSLDFSRVGFIIKTVMKHRNVFNTELKNEGNINIVPKEYRSSKQLRFLNELPILPISFCKTKPPLLSKINLSKYTDEGRKIINKNKKEETNLVDVTKNINPAMSMEYNVNRINKYFSQQGKCDITNKHLNDNEIHCHHIIPTSKGGTDEFSNLIILHKDIHRLIHLKSSELIEKYINSNQINSKELSKINYFRKKVGNYKIQLLQNSNKDYKLC